MFNKVIDKKNKPPSFSKSRKICIFAKGLLLVKDLKFIACVIFHRIGQEILFDNIQFKLDRLQIIVVAKNISTCPMSFKKVEKLAFLILVKNIKLLGFVFFYRTCLYILLDKVLEKKQAFLKLKNNLQKSKICIFAEGLLFVKKFEIYYMCNFP